MLLRCTAARGLLQDDLAIAVGSSRGHAPVVDLCERQAGLDADVELLRFGRVRAVDVLEAPLPQERLGVGGPGSWPKAAGLATLGQALGHRRGISARSHSGEGCPVLSFKTIRPKAALGTSVGARGPLEGRLRDPRATVRQLGQSQGTLTMLAAQELLLLGRCIGLGPPPLLLLLANAGHDGVTHDVHLGDRAGRTNLKLGQALTVEARTLVVGRSG